MKSLIRSFRFFLSPLVLLFIVRVSGAAQSVDTVFVCVPITTIVEDHGDVFTAKIGVGRIDGVLPKWLVDVYAIYSADEEPKGGVLIGRAESLTIGDSFSILSVTLDTMERGERSLRIGDLVSVPFLLPARDHHSVIFNLACQSIVLLDDDNEPFFTLKESLNQDSEEYEEKILQRMLSTVRLSGVTLQSLPSSDPLYQRLATAGYLNGKTVFAAMKEATLRDLRFFLNYVQAFSGTYMGNRWHLYEIYVSWIVNKALLSPNDVRDQLMAAGSDMELDILLNGQQEIIRTQELLSEWAGLAETWTYEGSIEKGKRLNAIVTRGSVLLRDNIASAWARFADARIAEYEFSAEMAEHTEPIAQLYREARLLFRYAGSVLGESFALNNLAGLLYQQGLNEEALGAYDTAIILKREVLETEGTPDNVESLGLSVEGRADVLAALDRPGEALDAYDSAFQLYDSARTENSPNNTASVSERAAFLLEDMGEYDEALGRLEFALENYRKIGKRDAEADVLDAIAYQHSITGAHRDALRYYDDAYAIHLALGDKDDAGYSKSGAGQAWWALGDYHNAEKAHRLAILLREEVENVPGQAYSWHKLGEIFSESGDPTSALDAFQQAGEMYRTLNDRTNLADVLNSAGDLYYGRKSWRAALDRYQEALTMRREAGAQGDIAVTLYNIGNVYYAQGDYTKAQGAFEESLEIRRSIGDKKGFIYSTASLGMVAWNLHDYDEAKRHLVTALARAEEIGSWSDMAWCKETMARLESQRGEYSSALADFTESLNLYREIDEKSEETEVLVGIGDINVQQGKFDEGIARFEEAKRIATEANNRSGIAQALISLAGIHLFLGEFDQAIEADREALEINREVGNTWGIASASTGMGNTYNTMGEYLQAITWYRNADSLYRELGDTLGRAVPINNVGTIYFFQGDYERALDQFNQVLHILRNAGQEDEFLSIVISNIGEVYYEKGRFDDAENWLNQALELEEKLGVRRMKASTLTILTKTLLGKGRHEEAEKRGAEALALTKEVGEREQLAEINAVLGELAMRRAEKGKAEEYFTASVDVSEKIGSTKYLWRPLYLLGTLHRDRGDREGAISLLERSVETIERLREKVAGGEAAQKLFASDRSKIEVYEALVSLLIEKGEIEKALGYLERSSSEDLRSRFKGLQPSFADPEKREILEKGKEMKARIDKLAEQISAERSGETGGNTGKIERLQQIVSVAENDYIRFVNETVREQPDLRNYFSSGVNPIELRQRKGKIPRDVAVVSYLLGERQIFAFVATADTVVARVIAAPRADVEWAIRTFCRSVEHPGDQADATANSGRLYDLLIAPIEDRIAGHDKLAIIPSGELSYLPFGVLKNKASDSATYLMERYTIFYISDLGVFLDRKNLSGKLQVIAFGDADGTLPSAEKEVKRIAALYPDSKVYVRGEATEERAKNIPQGYNVLHFATHGNLDYRRFENSWLTLAPTPSGGDDGHLTLEEIWGITNLADCKLVTLSACNTAVSDESVEGWPINPANAFLQVGVPRVVATLWQVDDEATAILMEEFYRDLADHGAAESLRLAQQKLAADPNYASPYYWGPFVLLGDWR